MFSAVSVVPVVSVLPVLITVWSVWAQCLSTHFCIEECTLMTMDTVWQASSFSV